MYFGHLIDLTDNEDEMEKLQFIQKRVKYGLPDKKSIDLYESGLADRFICQKVSDDVFLVLTTIACTDLPHFAAFEKNL